MIVENGKIVEDGPPAFLKTRTTSRYRQLLDTEHHIYQNVWQTADWQRLWLENGTAQVLRSEHSPRQKPTSQRDDLEQIRGIGPVIAERFYTAGIESFAALAQLTPEHLEAIAMPTRRIPGVNPQDWIDQARQLSTSQKF
ncbi:MAG: helix-hairpin-helix domain-containing protein [Caldilineaceae bacterium]